MLVGYECIHWLRNNRTQTCYAAMKLDMSKAYDRVEWPFLSAVLQKIGFHTTVVDLIMRCVMSVSYSFGVNCILVGRVKPGHGV